MCAKASGELTSPDEWETIEIKISGPGVARSGKVGRSIDRCLDLRGRRRKIGQDPAVFWKNERLPFDVRGAIDVQISGADIAMSGRSVDHSARRGGSGGRGKRDTDLPIRHREIG